MRSCALAHAIGLIQADVQAQEKLHCVTTDWCCSRKELLTTGQAQLGPKLLQHEAVSHVKKERLLTPEKIANDNYQINSSLWRKSHLFTRTCTFQEHLFIIKTPLTLADTFDLLPGSLTLPTSPVSFSDIHTD